MHKKLAILLTCLSLAACGGGGSDNNTTNVVNPTVTPSNNVANTVTVSVKSGPANLRNLVFADVTLCVPGTSTCATIDHMLVDTGSSGVRVVASALPAALQPTQQRASDGGALAACQKFADGFTWGSVRSADVRMAGEQASGIPIQLIGDPALASVPASCQGAGAAENTPQTLGANGIVGVGLFDVDCGPSCAATAVPGTYYSCAASGTCTPVAVPVANQIPNPVARFASDNNGSVIILPSVPDTGANTATGQLIFGIGTQTNNALGNAKVYTVDPNSGTFNINFNGASYPNSFIDSGSNAFYFNNGATPVCTNSSANGFYCPAQTQSLTATSIGANGTSGTVNFSVANAQNLVGGNSMYAFSNLAAPQLTATSFDLGLPFFYGRTVFTAIEGKTTPGGSGPYFAY